MRLIRAKDYQDVSRKAANIIAAQIYLKPDCVLGLATGSSPVAIGSSVPICPHFCLSPTACDSAPRHLTTTSDDDSPLGLSMTASAVIFIANLRTL